MLLVRGTPVTLHHPADALRLAIGMVHQHFMLVPVMTVAENFVLGAEPSRGVALDLGAAEARVRELSERYGLSVDPHARVADITVGPQQRVEILRALDRGAKVLILDEPTAVLTAQETDELFKVLDGLREQGTSIIFISHKLREMRRLTDRITVLRRGKAVGTVDTKDVDERELARLMVGRDVLLHVDNTPGTPGRPLLEVRDLVVDDDRGLRCVNELSLTVHAGEIVAIAGVDGNGQSELIDAICGLRAPVSGQVMVDGEDVTGRGPKALAEKGIGHIAEDRQRRGLILNFTLAENLALRDYDRDSRFGLMQLHRHEQRADELIAEFDVRGGEADTPARSLSGGNQQKLVIAREIGDDPQVLVAAQPTRGLDVGAIEFVHRRLIAERDAGRAVLLISFEVDEVRSLADRILVIFEGRIVGELPPTASDEELGLLMSGSGTAA
jgi:simple sugar transport system ATP-binding protein